MRAILQRVNFARVTVEAEITGEIGKGLLVLLGVHREDDEDKARVLANKVACMRIFEDEEGKMNRSLLDIGGEALVVSNFTLYSDTRKGRRPSFNEAAPYDSGAKLYERFCYYLDLEGTSVKQGRYGTHMDVLLENDGPVTILVDT
jgi:D-tyrosyl-tRNA(Tyr) deacylase